MNGWWLILLITLVALGVFVYDRNRNIDGFFKEVTYKEHRYLIYNCAGICHSPECGCQRKEK